MGNLFSSSNSKKSRQNGYQKYKEFLERERLADLENLRLYNSQLHENERIIHQPVIIPTPTQRPSYSHVVTVSKPIADPPKVNQFTNSGKQGDATIRSSIQVGGTPNVSKFSDGKDFGDRTAQLNLELKEKARQKEIQENKELVARENEAYREKLRLFYNKLYENERIIDLPVIIPTPTQRTSYSHVVTVSKPIADPPKVNQFTNSGKQGDATIRSSIQVGGTPNVSKFSDGKDFGDRTAQLNLELKEKARQKEIQENKELVARENEAYREKLRLFYNKLYENERIIDLPVIIPTPTQRTSYSHAVTVSKPIADPPKVNQFTNSGNQGGSPNGSKIEIGPPYDSESSDDTDSDDRNTPPKFNDIPQLKLSRLMKHYPHDGLCDLFKYDYSEIRHLEIFTIQLKSINFCDLFKVLLYVEDLEIERQVRLLTRTDVTITKCQGQYEKTKNLFECLLEYSIEKVSILDDHLFVVMYTSGISHVSGLVKSVGIDENNSTINLKIMVHTDAMTNYLISKRDEKFTLIFNSPRTTIQMEQTALEVVRKNNLLPFLFPSNSGAIPLPHINEELSWFNQDLIDNEEQKMAIKNIVLVNNRKAPYIVFGPPGTGKSTVIIESIIQILKRNPNAKILCCANSNGACNMITKKLLYFATNSGRSNKVTSVDAKDILRIYSKSTHFEDVDPLIMENSNFFKGEMHYFPCLEAIYEKKVIIATLVTCGRFDQGQINKNHFTHIFIDEAGSCRETSSLIPIVLSSHKTTINAQIILCGDPKQLGPVIRNKFVNSSCLGVPMIERLLELPLYKKDPKTLKFNSSFIVKLTKNYRSHPSIIAVPNKLFYDNEMVCVGDTAITHAALNSRLLINKNIPIIFQSIAGRCNREIDTPSLFNEAEITLVINYIDILLKSDLRNYDKLIGVITTYRKQSIKIQNICKKRFGEDARKIDVGTIDKFQGEERPIIILTTVRSQTNSIGFLNNPKRLNVALTRAQTFLIVIGNAETLSKDANWKEFVDFCKKNNCFDQSPPPNPKKKNKKRQKFY